MAGRHENIKGGLLERIEQRELPGNDASWYREMIAEHASARRAGMATERELREPAAAQEDDEPEDDQVPTALPPETDTLEADVAPAAAPQPDEASADSGDDAASDVVEEEVEEDENPADTAPAITPVPPIEADGPLENTSEMVGQLWTARDSYGPLEDWQPDDIDSKVGSRRTFRWSTLIGALAILALIAAGLVVLPSITLSRANAYLESITDPLQTLRGELPDAQNSLAVATDPASDTAALTGLTTQLTTFAAKASALDAATQADPPTAPPLTSSAPIDEIEPIRQQAEPLGTVAITIQRRIANLVEYRSLMDGFLVLPDLPTTATSDVQAELRVDLAAAQAESAAVLADLPSDVALESHTAMAREINERFATWQVDYLEALRTGDAAAAAELIAEIENDLAELDNALITPLAQIRRQSDADLIDLAREIDAVNALAAEIA